MIFCINGDGEALMILEPDDLKKLKEGKTINAPDGRVLVGYTPDVPWILQQMNERRQDNGIPAGLVTDLLKEGVGREEVVNRANTRSHSILHSFIDIVKRRKFDS